MQGPTTPPEPLLAKGLHFLEGADMIQGKATAYVCENYACMMPTNDPRVLADNIVRR